MHRALLWMVLLALVPGGLAAQSRLSGRLLEVFSGRALRCINVQLLDSAGTVLSSTETAPGGEFAFTVAGESEFRLRFFRGSLTDELTEPERAPMALAFDREYRVPLYVDLQNPSEGTSEYIESLPSSFAPEYPPDFRRRGIQGSAYLSFVVNPDGVVDTSSAFVLTATHAEFAVAVLRALPTLRFKPFVWTERTDCERTTQAFHFTLRR